MSSSSIRIAGLSTVSDDARAVFYRRMYPNRAEWLIANWRWWYRVGDVAGVEPLVAVADDVVIGHAGVIPARIRIQTTVRTALWFVDFAVLPDHQGKGLGKTLTEAWMALGDTYVTQCNDKSMGVFRKYGWREHHDMIRYGRPLRLAPLVRDHRSRAVRIAGTVLDRAATLWARAALRGAQHLEPHPLDADDLAPAFEIADETSIVRDRDWIRWRLIESPVRPQYRSFATHDARAVVRLFSLDGVERAHVLWLGGGTDADRRELARGVAAWGIRAGAALLWGVTNQREVMAAMDIAMPIKRPVRFAYFSADADCFEQLPRLTLQAIDSDTDMMYV